MVDMPSIHSSTAMNGVQQISRQKVMGNMQPGQMPEQNRDRLEKSGMGQLFLAVDQHSPEAHEVLKTFHEGVLSVFQSGSFDAVTLASNASDEVKELAEIAGIDLEDALTQLAENPPPIGYGPQGGRPPKPNLDQQLSFLIEELDLDEAQSSSLEEVLKQIQAQIMSLLEDDSDDGNDALSIKSILENQYNQILNLLNDEQAGQFSTMSLPLMQ
ncbi:hypothetical protein KAR48_00620 [bacterium]|nr:hypothetical protein [bacterium]